MKCNNTIQTPSIYPWRASYTENSFWSNCCLLREEWVNEWVNDHVTEVKTTHRSESDASPGYFLMSLSIILIEVGTRCTSRSPTDVRRSAVGKHKSLSWIKSATSQEVADFDTVDHAVSTVPEVEQIKHVLHFCRAPCTPRYNSAPSWDTCFLTPFKSSEKKL